MKPNEMIHDDLQIFIRKQLVNSAAKYKRIGMIGAVRLMKRLCARPEQFAGMSSGPNDRLHSFVKLYLARAAHVA